MWCNLRYEDVEAAYVTHGDEVTMIIKEARWMCVCTHCNSYSIATMAADLQDLNEMKKDGLIEFTGNPLPWHGKKVSS